jgi:2-keto-4-pentenoate hydratase/2-oxohepta-3-ene-1,7-dioic acid hydratase in catechol pathway
MKIVVIENLFGAGEPSISLRPDTSVLRNNDDFYMPNTPTDIRCGVGVAVRITRIAKCIDPRFAARCYDGVGVGVAFVDTAQLNRLRSAGLPCESAYCFDRSIAISPDFVAPAEIDGGEVRLAANNQLKQTFLISSLKESLDECVSRASNLLTLKTGDLVFVQMPIEVQVVGGESMVATLDEREMLNFQIK